MGCSIMRVKEASQPGAQTFCDYELCKLLIRPDTDIEWSTLNLTSTSILEVKADHFLVLKKGTCTVPFFFRPLQAKEIISTLNSHPHWPKIVHFMLPVRPKEVKFYAQILFYKLQMPITFLFVGRY